MPRPPLLPLLDWPAILATGRPYADWITEGESPENRAKIEERRQNQRLEPPIEGLLQALPRTVHVAAFAEAWCGDVTLHVPVLQRLADATPNLQVRYLEREDSPAAFVRFLTNGGEAIPKFVFLNDQYVECGSWGPMPALCRKLIARGKACGNLDLARKKVAAVYESDPNRRMTIEELVRLIEIASAREP